jgi:hypothetical protein
MSSVDDTYLASPWSFVNQGQAITVFYGDQWVQLPYPWHKVKYNSKTVGKKGSKHTLRCVVWSGPTLKSVYRLAWNKLSMTAVGVGTLSVLKDGIAMVKAGEYKRFLSKFS